MEKINKSISVVVPAFNEERNLTKAIKNLLNVLEGNFKDYEILIFDDCSSDRTGTIAERLAKQNKNIKVIHNKKNMGLGYNYIQAAKMAKMEFFTLFPGDNENLAKPFYESLKQIKNSDIIIPYPTNMEVRKFSRRIISNLYTNILNFLFGLNLKYFNGTVVYKTSLLKNLETSYGFAYSSEILVRLLKQGHNYIEIETKINPSKESSAFRLKNIVSTVFAILSLFFDVHFKNRKKYNKKPRCIKKI